MLINMNMGVKDDSLHSASPIQFNGSPMPEHYATVEIPAPPPPPPPNLNLSGPPGSPFPTFDTKRRSRLRNFNWEAIPLEKVKGRPSLWSSETFQGDLQIDTRRMEELFGKQEKEIQQGSPRTRRSLSLGDTQMTKVFLLDSRRSMNIGIFLKQFKRSAAEIVEDIKRGNGDAYSSERLGELLKHLPEREEVKRLKSFQGDKERLSEADIFMLLLLDLPSYALRLEALIFKKDFHAIVLSLLSTARELKGAAEELLQCTELHYILRLILKAGNFMNAGGYAGNAAGFRVSSLLKLADTKANKPGMNLLHFVVMEVQKKEARYLSFADRLKHVSISSRLSEDGLLEEFCKLQSRVTSMRQILRDPEQKDVRQQMDEFLEYAEDKLREVQKEIEVLQNSKHLLIEFLCEDEETFHLEECCKIFSCFCQRFQLAIKENKIRELEEQRQQQWEKKRLEKRHSMASCSSLELLREEDELELTLERNLRNSRKTGSFRLCRMRSLGSSYISTQMSRKSQSERIQYYCDQQNAVQMREVSERVLRQQMGYAAYKDFYKSNAVNVCNVHSIDTRNSVTTKQSPTQTDLQIPNQSPDQTKLRISRQLLVLKVADTTSPLLSQSCPDSLGYLQNKSQSGTSKHSLLQSETEAFRPSNALSELKSSQYSLAKSEGTSGSTLLKQDAPLVLNQTVDNSKLEITEPLPVKAELGLPHDLIDHTGIDFYNKSLTQPTEHNCQLLTSQSASINPQEIACQSASDRCQQVVCQSASDNPEQIVCQSGNDNPKHELCHGQSATNNPQQIVCQSVSSNSQQIMCQSKTVYQSAIDHPKQLEAQIEIDNQKLFVVQFETDNPIQFVDQPGIDNQKPLEAQFETDNLKMLAAQSKTDDLKTLVAQYDIDNSKQFIVQSSDEPHRQYKTNHAPDIPSHLSTQSVSKFPFQPMSQKETKHLSPETETQRHSVQDIQESLRHTQPEPQTKKNSHVHSQSVLVTSIKSKAQSGPETQNVLLQSRLKIYRRSLAKSETDTPDSSLFKSEQDQSLGQPGEEMSWTKLGNSAKCQLQNNSGIRSTRRLTSHSWSKIPKHSGEYDASILEPTYMASNQMSQNLKPIFSQPETDTTQCLDQSRSDHSICQVANDVTPQSLTQDMQGSDFDRQSTDQLELGTATDSSAQSRPVPSISSMPQTPKDAASQSLSQDKQETQGQSSEQLRQDTSKKSLAQSYQKTSKQSLHQSTTKISRQSIPKPSPKNPRKSLDQVDSETSIPSTSDIPKHTLAKPGSFNSRIKLTEPVSVRHDIKAKEINVQIPTTEDKLRESQNGTAQTSKVGEDFECKSLTKVLKDVCTSVHTDSPDPCSKWKKELQNTCDRDDCVKRELKTERNSSKADWEDLGQRSGNNPKNSLLGRAGSNTCKKSKTNEFGYRVRRVHSDKEVPSVSIQGVGNDTKQRMPTFKQTQNVSRDSKLPQKLSQHGGGTLKPCSGKIMASAKVQKEIPHLNTNEYSKVSDRKCSPSVTVGKSVDGSLHNGEPSRESDWPSQVTSKKTNSTARLAIRVIKNCELSSSLPRGSRNLHVDPQKIWR
ncbi:formin-J-like [Pelobates fuscus]|uniref:formin-J-like n=1 Tax=Pelobates fuscus TaxID=191477 RepID=UPI002FE4A7FE